MKIYRVDHAWAATDEFKLCALEKAWLPASWAARAATDGRNNYVIRQHLIERADWDSGTIWKTYQCGNVASYRWRRRHAI